MCALELLTTCCITAAGLAAPLVGGGIMQQRSLKAQQRAAGHPVAADRRCTVVAGTTAMESNGLVQPERSRLMQPASQVLNVAQACCRHVTAVAYCPAVESRTHQPLLLLSLPQVLESVVRTRWGALPDAQVRAAARCCCACCAAVPAVLLRFPVYF